MLAEVREGNKEKETVLMECKQLTDWQRELVEKHLNLARHIANKMARGDYVNVESVAFEALCDAALRYDPSKSRFSTFATPCIEGRIRKYFNEEVPFASMRTHGKRVFLEVESLDRPHYTQGDGDDAETTLLTEQAEPCTADEQLIVEDFLSRLPERQRQIVEMRLQGGTQKEIARVIGITQGHVSRILRQIGLKWRAYQDD